MKKALSISIGSSTRDKTTQIDLLGQTVQLERRGTDGNLQAAASLYRQFDGQVDALGVGGTDLGLLVNRQWYPIHSTAFIFRHVKHTPLVDGTGLKVLLESRVPAIIQEHFGLDLTRQRVFSLTAVDRWGLSHAFVQAGSQCRFGDLLFSLQIPRILTTEKQVERLARLMMPIALRLPFEWIYPTGPSQEKRTPKYAQHFEWANIIAGDCHYLKRYMPDRLPGRILVTNTTTRQDREFFRAAGVRGLVTTTPLLDGRTFGTNMMEAALLAADGYNSPVDYAHPHSYFDHLSRLLHQSGIAPQIEEF